MIKACPSCGSKLVTAYRKRPPEGPQYVVFCANSKGCKVIKTGKGETVDDAVSDFHSGTTPSLFNAQQ